MWLLCLLGSLAIPDEVADSPASPDLDIVVELFAEAPLIVTPTGIAADGGGRVFVAESHTHFRPEEYKGPAADRILLLTDKNDDGKADEASVFHEGFTHVMDLEFAPDGTLYVATRMDIHQMQDRDNDGVADEIIPIVRLETTGTYPHNGISGLCFNQDGSMNFGLGENLGHEYTLIGTDGTRVSGGGEGGSTYRINTDGTQLRRVTTGWWNPFGMCVDARGRIFGTDNDPGASPPCRLIQIHEQADYGYEYRYGRTGLHPLISWTGELPGNIPMIAGTGEAPCGIISTERTNLPHRYRNDLLVASWADHRIERYEISTNDNIGQVTAERSVLVAGPNDFRPVGLCVAPNGDIFVSDWVLASYQLHGRGRIWRIRSRDRLPLTPPKGSPPTPPATGSVRARIAALQAKYSPALLPGILQAMKSTDPLLRHNAIQALVQAIDDGRFTPESDLPDGHVLLAVKRSRLRFEFGKTGVLPKVLQFGDSLAWQVAVKWIADDKLQQHLVPLREQMDRTDLSVRQYLMLSAAIDRLEARKPTDIPPEAELRKLATDDSRTVALRTAALRLLDPQTSPLPLDSVIELTLHEHAQLRINAIRHLGHRNDKEAIARLTEIASDRSTPKVERLEAIVAISTVRERAEGALIDLSKSPSLEIAQAALQGLVGIDLNSSTQQGIRALAAANPGLQEYAARALGDALIRPNASNTEAWMRLIDQPGDVKAGERIFFHPSIGTCGRCHQHSGRGNAVGPGLSVISRRLSDAPAEAKRWLLETILQPSRDMAPQYTPWTIVTTDGKQMTGLPRRKGGTQEAYLGIDGKEFSVRKESIEFHQESRTSIMPEGLLQNLTRNEINDLFAFLMQSR